MHRFRVYIQQCSLDRSQMYDKKTGGVRMAFNQVVLAGSYRDALMKCLPQIQGLLKTITDPTIKYVSVFVGQARKSRPDLHAERLSPFQLDVLTGNIRERLK